MSGFSPAPVPPGIPPTRGDDLWGTGGLAVVRPLATSHRVERSVFPWKILKEYHLVTWTLNISMGFQGPCSSGRFLFPSLVRGLLCHFLKEKERNSMLMLVDTTETKAVMYPMRPTWIELTYAIHLKRDHFHPVVGQTSPLERAKMVWTRVPVLPKVAMSRVYWGERHKSLLWKVIFLGITVPIQSSPHGEHG